jgi:hypothetical protein
MVACCRSWPQVQTPRGRRSDAPALASMGGAGLKLTLPVGGASSISPIQETRWPDSWLACSLGMLHTGCALALATRPHTHTRALG